MNINDRIIERCRDLKMSQVKLAALVGVTKGAVNQWFKGVSAPSGENLLRTADALKVSERWLQLGVEPKEPIKSEAMRVINEQDETMLKLAKMMLPVATPHSNAHLQRIIEGLEQNRISDAEKKELEVMLKVIAERFFPKGAL